MGLNTRSGERVLALAVTALELRNARLCGRNGPRAVGAPFAHPGSDTGEQARGAHSPFLDSAHRQAARHYSVGRRWVRFPRRLDSSRDPPSEKMTLEDHEGVALISCLGVAESRSRRTRCAILLNARSTQTSKTVVLERPFPTQELFLRKLVDTAGLLHRQSAATDRSDHRGLATDYPSFSVPIWQIVHERCPVQ